MPARVLLQNDPDFYFSCNSGGRNPALIHTQYSLVETVSYFFVGFVRWYLQLFTTRANRKASPMSTHWDRLRTHKVLDSGLHGLVRRLRFEFRCRGTEGLLSGWCSCVCERESKDGLLLLAGRLVVVRMVGAGRNAAVRWYLFYCRYLLWLDFCFIYISNMWVSPKRLVFHRRPPARGEFVKKNEMNNK